MKKHANHIHVRYFSPLLPIAIVTAFCFLLASCIEQKEQRLPIFGEKDVTGTDTLYHTIGNFRLVNQDSVIVTPETLRSKIYVADFFTSQKFQIGRAHV